MQHSTPSVSTSIISSVCTPRALPPEVEMMEVRLDGMNPPGCEAVLVEIIDRRAAGIRVRQGARTTEWLPTSQIMIEVGPLAAMHTLTRLYVPRWLIERTGLHTLTRDQVERDRAGLIAHRERWEQRRELVEVLHERQLDRELDEPQRHYDEALAECSFESSEQLAQRAHDGRRYHIIALDPSLEDNAQNRAQVYAYALIEHFVELMDARQYTLAIRECKHWMHTISEGRDGMEPETRDAIWTVLCRVRAAANEARKSKAFTLSDLTERRQQELDALARHARRARAAR